MKFENNVNIRNKRAWFEYEILEEYEAGIVLTGTEIKSVRESKASITEAFCQLTDGELYVVNMSIDEYKLGTYYNHKMKRERKLLLHRREIEKLKRRVKDVGYTIIPLNFYIDSKGLAKLKIAVGRGKKLYDKRETLKERDAQRSLGRLNKQS